MPDSLTREEALAKGFHPVAGIAALAAKHRMSVKAFKAHKAEFVSRMQVQCNNNTVGQVCFDWTDDQNVRTICYCTQAHTCEDCVQS